MPLSPHLVRALAEAERVHAEQVKACEHHRQACERSMQLVQELRAACLDGADTGLVNLKAATHMTGKSERTLRRAAKAGDIGEMVNGQWRFDPRSLVDHFGTR